MNTKVIASLTGQERAVLNLLRDGGKYAVTEMCRRLWLADPRSVIRNLRNKGLPIEDEWRKSSNEHRYKVYFLRVVNLQK